MSITAGMLRAPLYLPTRQQRTQQQPGPDCMYLANGQVVCSSHAAAARHAATAARAAAYEGFAASLPDPESVQPISLAALQFLASDVQLSGIHSVSTPDKLSPGLTWNRYDQGYFNDNFAAFAGLTPTATGTTNGWSNVNQATGDSPNNMLPIAKNTEFSFTVTGYFLPQTTGTYTFVLVSDDAGYLWLGSDAVSSPSNGNVSINNGGLHGMNAIKASVSMTAGQVYPLLIMYGQNFGGFGMQFGYSTPNGQITTDGTGFFFSDAPVIVGPGAGSRPGLSWFRYDQGYFNDQPSAFRGLTPSESGTTNGWNDLDRTPGGRTAGFLPISKTSKFSFVVSGMFVPLKTGAHKFLLSSDDASYMWIGSGAVGDFTTFSTSSAKINLGGLHGNNTQSVDMDMLAGQAYPLLIMFGQNEGGFNLEFAFKVPDRDSFISDGTAYFFTTSPAPPMNSPQGATQGLTWQRFDQGYFNDHPSWFKGISPSATGTTNGWNDLDRNPHSLTAGFLPIARTDQFSYLVWGAFMAQTSGVHSLTMSSDDASYLWFGPAALGDPTSVSTGSSTINLGGLHGNNANTINVTLVAGQTYPMLMMFGQSGGGFNFSFMFTIPGSGQQFTDGTGFFFTAAPGTAWPATSVAPSGFSGRFIKLMKPVSGCMHFAEVQVFSPGSGTNVAQGKQVTTSSVGWGGLAQFLTDGVLNNFTHSDCNDRPWFLIDLGSVLPIATIRVFNRVDCCQARENGVIVTVLDGNQNEIFKADPLADKNGVIVDGGDAGATYSVFDINPPATTVNGGTGQITFHLQDVTTGALVRYASGSNQVTENPAAEVVNWRIFNDTAVFNNNQGAVGLVDDKTNKCIRHSGFVTWENPFESNNFDFAWVFRRGSQEDVYTIFNFYGSNMFLNYNGSQLLISSDTPREWLVLGNDEARKQIRSIAR